jgi:hypothetical protein
MFVKLRNKNTGEEIERRPIDARELIDSGEWAPADEASAPAVEEPAPEKPAKKGKGKSSEE